MLILLPRTVFPWFNRQEILSTVQCFFNQDQQYTLICCCLLLQYQMHIASAILSINLIITLWNNVLCVQLAFSSSFILQEHKFTLICNICCDTIFEHLPHYEGTCALQSPN